MNRSIWPSSAQIGHMAVGQALQFGRGDDGTQKRGLPKVSLQPPRLALVQDAGVPAPDIIISHQIGSQIYRYQIPRFQVHGFRPGEKRSAIITWSSPGPLEKDTPGARRASNQSDDAMAVPARAMFQVNSARASGSSTV